MRVAFVQDWLVVSGGAEKVTREILKIWDADVFALVDHLNQVDRDFVLHGKVARTSFIQNLPWSKSHYRNYLPLFTKAIESLDLSSYDLIISSSYAVAKGVRKTRQNQIHVCYIHAPMRYAWEQRESYYQDHDLHRGIKRFVADIILNRIQKWDVRSSDGVDLFIANSVNIANRVKRYYGRSAKVLIPPVDLQMFGLYEGPREGYIASGRVVPYKKFDLIADAFRLMPEKQLTITGSGPQLDELRASAPPNVTFVGHLEMSDLIIRMQRAKALIAAANEDLGLTPIEAAACGTPTIALKTGGYLETVKEGQTGWFFDKRSPEKIAQAVNHFEMHGLPLTPSQLRGAVEFFSCENFRRRFKTEVDSLVQEYRANA
jgi:glycosyltransferase involved in cell wall biosynthesis